MVVSGVLIDDVELDSDATFAAGRGDDSCRM
jgi:hypothetical protein